MLKLLASLVAIVIALLGCASIPDSAPLPQEGVARVPEVVTDPVTGERSSEISVLIYNVAGLPWPIGCGKSARMGEGVRIPIRCNRSAALKTIGDELAAMRSRGEESDIVLIQEGFIGASSEIPKRGEYPNWVAGPARGDKAPKVSAGVEESFVDERNFWRGEKLAHNLQIDEIDDFLHAVSDPSLPIVWGGVLNMRNARDRLDYLVKKSKDPILEVSSFCMYEVDDCEVPFSWGSDEPWLDTQDLQGWAPGAIVTLRPVAVNTLFDEPVDGKMPSDHIGVLVRYRLSWMPEGE